MKLSASKGTRAGEQLVHDHADRIDVGAMIERLAERLLGRHVVRRAEDRRRCASALCAPSAPETLAMPKSRIFTTARPFFCARKMFSGFMSRWTMPLSCAAREPAARPAARCRAPHRRRAAASCCMRSASATPVEELHRQVHRARRQRREIVDLDDVLVTDRRRRPRLLAEARHRLGVRDDLGAQQLDARSAC